MRFCCLGVKPTSPQKQVTLLKLEFNISSGFQVSPTTPSWERCQEMKRCCVGAENKNTKIFGHLKVRLKV